MATVDTIHSHSFQHFEDLQLSAQQFYTILEKKIAEYKYPNVVCKKVSLKEAGMFSGSREYCCVMWERHRYYVCAAPFGKSFFISWWHKEEANTGAKVMGKIFGKGVQNTMDSKTYFELDNELMFTNSINSIIKMAVEIVKTYQGYREENPIQLK